MINKMTLFPRLSSGGSFLGWATDSIMSSYFEGSQDGTTYTKILTIQDEPPQVGWNVAETRCILLHESLSSLLISQHWFYRGTALTTLLQAPPPTALFDGWHAVDISALLRSCNSTASFSQTRLQTQRAIHLSR